MCITYHQRRRSPAPTYLQFPVISPGTEETSPAATRLDTPTIGSLGSGNHTRLETDVPHRRGLTTRVRVHRSSEGAAGDVLRRVQGAHAPDVLQPRRAATLHQMQSDI